MTRIRIPLVVLLAFLVFPAASQAAVTATLTPTTTFNFNNRQVGATPPATRTYTVTSTGDEALTIGASAAVTVTGTDPAEFEILNDNCSGKTLTTGQTCTVQLGFAPDTTGAKSARLSVATSGPTLESNVNSGTGRDLASDATGLSFSQRVGSGATTAQTVTFTNEDAADYTLGNVTITGGSANQFAKGADTCSAQTLSQNETCTVEVTFNPTSPGAKTGALAIASYGPNPVSLTGNGDQPAASVTPAGSLFADRALSGGPSAPKTVTLTNTGTGPLDVGEATVAGADAGDFSLTADQCSEQPLPSGESCTVGVRFDPSSAGFRRATLEIPTDAANSPVKARLEGRGKGSGSDTVFDTPIDLFAQPFARLSGDGGDTAGGAVASGPCDVDGDGFDDTIVGASLWSRQPAVNSWEGGAYVNFGGPNVGGTDLAEPEGKAILMEGETPGAQTGYSVGCADVNGDDIDDVLVGAWAYEYEGRPTSGATGIAYVVFGSDDLREQGPLDLGSLGERGYKIAAPTDGVQYDHLGYAVAGLGDLDGDGKDEVGVMSNTSDSPDKTPARTNNGNLYVVPGQSETDAIDVTDSANTLLRVDGASPGTTASPFGQMNSLTGLGDVNGDDTPDIGIGTYTAVAFGRSTASGALFAISGDKIGAGNRIDLAESSSYLFAVGGAFAGHRLGISIDSAGDVDGDGLQDIVAGADSTAGANSDAAYVIYGAENGTDPGQRQDGVLLDSSTLGADGYRIRGGAGDSTGYGVSGVGDIDGDDLDDVAVTAYGADTPAGAGAGAGWIVYGVEDSTTLPADTGRVPASASDTTGTIPLAGLPADQGTTVAAQTAGERFGRSVGGVGDHDGNGAADVAFGSDQAVRFGRNGAGEVGVALLPGPARAAEPEEPIKPTVPKGGGGLPTKPGSAPPASPSRTSARLELTRTRFRIGRSGVLLRARCRGTSKRCQGILSLRVGRRIGRVRFSVQGGHSKVVRVKLSRALRRQIARRRSLRARVGLAAGTAGDTGANTRRYTIRLLARR